MIKLNRIVVSGTIVIIVLMIGIPTFFNIKKDHEEKLIKASENKIADAAKQCFLDEKCKGESTNLQSLYNMGYLDVQVNPITKKYYNESSIIKYTNKKIDLDLN